MGSRVAIYRSGESITTIQCRLNRKCTNNQAEQFAILTALEHIEKIQTKDKRATIYTDSQTTLDKLQNSKIHTHIAEEIRGKITAMKESEWEITLCWIKAHTGIRGNELADTLAKKAATNKNITESYNKIPKSVLMKDIEEESIKKWQRQWAQTNKGRTREYFPDVTKIKDADTTNTKPYSHSKRACENERLPTSLQNNRRANVSIRERRPDNRPHNLCMRKADKGERQNKEDSNTNK